MVSLTKVDLNKIVPRAVKLMKSGSVLVTLNLQLTHFSRSGFFPIPGLLFTRRLYNKVVSAFLPTFSWNCTKLNVMILAGN